MRLIGEAGEQIGIKSRQDALDYAFEKNLDLVEVAGEADPPVCRVMDYGKYRYEQEQKAKIARKHQLTIQVKEIKLRPKISSNDYNTKKGHVVRFLKDRAKVKVTIMFRGREQTHPERGRQLLMQLAEDVAELGQIESAPLQDGRNMTMVLAPLRNLAAAEEASANSGEPAATPEAQSAEAAATPEAQPAEAEAAPDAEPADAEPEAAADEPVEDKESADA